MNSPIFAASFTDVFGVEHPSAQCMISSVSTSSNLYFDNEGASTSGQQYCNYQVRYWHSPETKAAGARTQDFMNADMATTLYINDAEPVSGADVIAACKEHFLKSVITKVAVTGQKS